MVGTQPAPPTWLVVTCGLVALAAVLPDRVWRFARNAATITHEGGHALAALVTGRRLAGIRLHADTSGVTVSAGRPTGPGMVLTSAAGYTASPLLGLGGAWLLAAGHVTALLWISLLLLGGMLLLIRNPYGALSILAAGGAVFLVSWLTPATVQAGFAYLLTWFLLFGGMRPVVELQNAAAAAPPTPTPTSSPASRASQAWSGSACSPSPPSPRSWSEPAGCCTSIKTDRQYREPRKVKIGT